MFYCNKDCQKTDWKFHKDECKLYKKDYLESGGGRLTLRLYLTFKRNILKRFEKFQVPGTDPPEYKTYMNLSSHLVEIGKDEKKSENFLLFLECFREAGLSLDLKEESRIFEHFCKVNVNLHIIQDNCSNHLACSIFVPNFEHSCVPNACLIPRGLKHEIRAIKKISPGEKITINRIGFITSREKRQKIFKVISLFPCSCPRCINDDIDKGKISIF